MQKLNCSKCEHFWMSEKAPEKCPNCKTRKWAKADSAEYKIAQDNGQIQPVENTGLPMVAGESESNRTLRLVSKENSKPSPPKSKKTIAPIGKCWLDLPKVICPGGLDCWHKEIRLAYGLKEKK